MLLHRAVFKCIAIGLAYVAPFYLRRNHARNHSSTIKFRMASTAATSLLAWLPLYCQALELQVPSARQLLLPLLGLRANGLLQAIVRPTMLTATLFAGPLLQMLLAVAADQEGTSALQTLRNLIVAPVTEEFCFRACMSPLLLLQGCSFAKTVLLTPLMFGVAHVHHLVEMVKFQGVKLTSAVAVVSFQFAYTTIFGWYATHIFLSTGHLAGAVAVHAFCNCMGFPPVGEVMHSPCRKLLLSAYSGGIVAFCLLLRPWTNPGQYGCNYADLILQSQEW